VWEGVGPVNAPYDLNSKQRQVRYLIETVPGLLDHPIFPLLLYWKVFDGCDIPKSTFESIMARGTPPDSLTRLVRFALADIREDRRNAAHKGEDPDEEHRHLSINNEEKDPES
jgi:hypothetical protein